MPPGNGVTAADGALASSAKIVSDSRSQLSGELKALEGKLEGLMAQWKGGGGSKFQAVINQWKGDATKIISALDTFSANLTSSQSTYTATDSESSSSFAKIAGRLG